MHQVWEIFKRAVIIKNSIQFNSLFWSLSICCCCCCCCHDFCSRSTSWRVVTLVPIIQVIVLGNSIQLICIILVHFLTSYTTWCLSFNILKVEETEVEDLGRKVERNYSPNGNHFNRLIEHNRRLPHLSCLSAFLVYMRTHIIERLSQVRLIKFFLDKVSSSRFKNFVCINQAVRMLFIWSLYFILFIQGKKNKERIHLSMFNCINPFWNHLRWI